MRYLLTIAALLAACVSSGQISTVSGTFTSGETVTIGGVGLGHKIVPAPLHYDDWSSAAIGDTPGEASSSWWYDGVNVQATADNLRHSGLVRTMLIDFPEDTGAEQPGAWFLRDNILSDHLYVNFWIRWEWGDHPYAYQVKFVRWDSDFGYGETVNTYPTLPAFAWAYPGTPAWRTNWSPRGYPSGGCSSSTLGSWNQTLPTPTEDPMWINVAIEIDQSDLENTVVKNWQTNHLGNAIYAAINTLDISHTCLTANEKFQVLKIGGNVESSGPACPMYLAEIYADTSRARVEIGDEPEYSDCAVREIQLVTAWESDGTGVQFTVRQGSFSAGATAYLFVVRPSGEPTAGYQITFGGSGSSSAPSNMQISRDGNTATLAVTRESPLSDHLVFAGVADDTSYTVTTSTNTADITVPAASAITARARAVDASGHAVSESGQVSDGGS